MYSDRGKWLANFIPDFSFQFRREFIKIVIIPDAFPGSLGFQFLDDVIRFKFLDCLADI